MRPTYSFRTASLIERPSAFLIPRIGRFRGFVSNKDTPMLPSFLRCKNMDFPSVNKWSIIAYSQTLSFLRIVMAAFNPYIYAR